jgi:hypothetical protein
VIAGAIGAPTEPELREVACADHEATSLVGNAKQVVGAQSSLDVFERQIVDRLAPRERVVQVGEHLPRRWTDVDLPVSDAERVD